MKKTILMAGLLSVLGIIGSNYAKAYEYEYEHIEIFVRGEAGYNVRLYNYETNVYTSITMTPDRDGGWEAREFNYDTGDYVYYTVQPDANGEYYFIPKK